MHDYGNRGSILQNHIFNYKDFPAVANTLDGWVRGNSAKFEPLFDNTGEEDGVLIDETDIPTSGPSPLSVKKYIAQTVTGCILGTDSLTVDIDFGFINYGASPVSTTISIGVTGAELVQTETAPVGWSGWFNFKTAIAAVSGDVEIKLYAGRDSLQNIKSAFKDVKIRATTSALQTFDSVEYSVTNATYGQTKEIEYLIGDGPAIDNVALQYNGGITIGGVATTSWNTRGGSENDLLVELIGGQIGGQFARTKHLLDISLYEMEDSYLKIFGRFEDVLNQYNGNNRKFAVVRANYDVKNRLWDLTLNEGVSIESLYLLDDSGDTITDDAGLLIEITAY